VNTVWFDELPPYPVRSFTYRNEQVGADEVKKVIVYNTEPLIVRQVAYAVAIKF
jgi:hypothetical protein